jgi:hypothetical protein
MIMIAWERMRGLIEDLSVKCGYYNHPKFTADFAPNPVYLVEYPKSGVTYLASLLANYYTDRAVNYFNVHQYVGDLHAGKLNNSATGNYNFYKTHSEVNSNFFYIIHLVRGPEDTLVSYYNYYTTRTEYQGSFSDFIRSRRGMRRYVRHVTGWINCLKDARYVPISYERLCREPKAFLVRWCELNGEVPSAEGLEKALASSSKISMLQQEQLYRGGGRNFQAFIGEKAFKLEDVCERDRALIAKFCGPTYEAFAQIEARFYGS